MKTLLGTILIASFCVGVTTDARATLNSSTEKELMLAIIPGIADEAKTDKDSAIFYCYAIAYKLTKYPRMPADVAAELGKTCQPLWGDKSMDTSGVAAAVKKHGEKLKHWYDLNHVHPLGSPWNMSKDENLQICAAAASAEQAVADAAAFVKDMPHPRALSEYQADTETLMAVDQAAKALWFIAVGPVLAAQMRDRHVIPFVIKKMEDAEKKVAGDGVGAFGLSITANDIDEQIEVVRACQADHPAIAQYTAAVSKLRERAVQAYRDAVAEVRMPGDNYKKGDRGQLDGMVKATMAPENKLLRITISSDDWTQPKTYAWWNPDGTLEWGTYRSVQGGTAAFETKGKDLEQYQMQSFRISQKLGPGGWGKPYIRWIAGFTPILKENISK